MNIPCYPGCPTPDFIDVKLQNPDFVVCRHCRKILKMNGFGFVNTGSVSKMPHDMSPFEVGMEGDWNGKKFQIVGRKRYFFESGYYRNHWVILFANGTISWLTDSYGFYGIVSQIPFQLPSSRLAQAAPDSQMTLHDGNKYVIDCISSLISLDIEGEIPESQIQFSSLISLEFSYQNRLMAIVDWIGGAEQIYYQGQMVKYEDFLFKQPARSMKDWF
jgi:hypothetical protein